MRLIVSAFVLAAVALAWKPASAQTPADIVLLNGKIVTVDDRFTIAEALAVKGERILAVGSNAEIEKHKGPLTRVVDLNRRTVIPGLIDNHAHYMRAAEYWHREVRLDGITPNNPVALQLFYFRVYANTAALKAMGIGPTTPDPAGIKIEKDDTGELTGTLNGGSAIGLLRGKLGEVARDKAVENAR